MKILLILVGVISTIIYILSMIATIDHGYYWFAPIWLVAIFFNYLLLRQSLELD